MVFDTDIFIWIQRGSSAAAKVVNSSDRRCLSIFSYMEFLQGSLDKRQLHLNQAFLRDMGFETLSLTENIGHRPSSVDIR